MFHKGKKTKGEASREERKREDKPFNPAFEKALGGLYKEMKKPTPKPPTPVVRRETAPSSVSDEEIFAAEMADVSRLSAPPMPPKARCEAPAPVCEEDDALMFMDALSSGESVFDIADTDEFIEGCVTDLDRRVLKKLRRGEFAVQAHVDLHGMTRDEAKSAVVAFVRGSRLAGHRCVLIVHGRGMHSKDQIPVLKDAIRSWLSRGAVGARVLAFATARPADGGAGAVYVLLRK